MNDQTKNDFIMLSNSIIDQTLASNNRKIIRIGDYIGNNIVMDWKCEKCDNTWGARARCVIHLNTGCPFCAGKVPIVKTLINRLSSLKLECIGKVLDSKTKTDFRCMVCEYVWNTAPECILYAKAACPMCDKIAVIKKADDSLLGRNIVRLGKFIDMKTKIEYLCNDCGDTWLAIPDSVCRMRSGCPKCNTPGKNEKLMHVLLSNAGISHEQQYDIRKVDQSYPPYKADAFIPDIKIMIEYNGIQHYEPARFGARSSDEAGKALAIQQKRDNFVRSICKTYNIFLLEIDGRKYFSKRLEKFMGEVIPLILHIRNAHARGQDYSNHIGKLSQLNDFMHKAA